MNKPYEGSPPGANAGNARQRRTPGKGTQRDPIIRVDLREGKQCGEDWRILDIYPSDKHSQDPKADGLLRDPNGDDFIAPWHLPRRGN